MDVFHYQRYLQQRFLYPELFVFSALEHNQHSRTNRAIAEFLYNWSNSQIFSCKMENIVNKKTNLFCSHSVFLIGYSNILTKSSHIFLDSGLIPPPPPSPLAHYLKEWSYSVWHAPLQISIEPGKKGMLHTFLTVTMLVQFIQYHNIPTQ